MVYVSEEYCVVYSDDVWVVEKVESERGSICMCFVVNEMGFIIVKNRDDDCW